MVKRRTIRVYADTSVFGGVFDDEFAEASRGFFDAVRAGIFVLATSEVVRQEIEVGPRAVQDFYESVLPIAELATVTDEVLQLQQAYLDAGIVGERSATDALHVALATVAQAVIIVSWNFKHIVNFQKIPMYNAVNALHGQREIAIYSPLEVIAYED